MGSINIHVNIKIKLDTYILTMKKVYSENIYSISTLIYWFLRAEKLSLGYTFISSDLIGLTSQLNYSNLGIKMDDLFHKQNLTIEEVTALVINHEQMHIWLCDNEGIVTSYKYDSIVDKLRKEGYAT